MTDLIDHLLREGRQLKSNAYPLVEITLMRQPARGRTLLHLVNVSGHSDTAYFAPIEMHDITVEVIGDFHKAHAVALNRELTIARAGRYSRIVVPTLHAYEVVVLE
jgi:hypothetical protein